MRTCRTIRRASQKVFQILHSHGPQANSSSNGQLHQGGIHDQPRFATSKATRQHDQRRTGDAPPRAAIGRAGFHSPTASSAGSSARRRFQPLTGRSRRPTATSPGPDADRALRLGRRRLQFPASRWGVSPREFGRPARSHPASAPHPYGPTASTAPAPCPLGGGERTGRSRKRSRNGLKSSYSMTKTRSAGCCWLYCFKFCPICSRMAVFPAPFSPNTIDVEGSPGSP